MNPATKRRCPSGQGDGLKIRWRKPRGFEPHSSQLSLKGLIKTFFFNRYGLGVRIALFHLPLVKKTRLSTALARVRVPVSVSA